MKNTFLLVAFFLLFGCQSTRQSIILTIANNSSVKLKDKAVAIERSQFNESSIQGYPLITNEQNDTIPYQLDDLDDDGNWDQLFFVIDLAPEEKVLLSLKWVETASTFPQRTSVRLGKRNALGEPVNEVFEEVLMADQVNWAVGFQKYQTDGPMWENDKIGFRQYLDGRNSKDLFGKKIADISPETVGLDSLRNVVDNYHVMEDWGRDILSVGNSVGLGGYGLLIDSTLLRLGVWAGDTLNNVATTTFKIITEGPVLSQMSYQYENWTLKDRLYNVKETGRIWPGMYAFENTVQIKNLQGDETLVIGLVNSNTEDSLNVVSVNEKFTVLYTYDYQTYGKEWKLGLGLILPADVYIGYAEAPTYGRITNTFLAKLKIKENVPVTYYPVAGWELSPDDFTNEENFKAYITDLANQLAAEISINIIK